MEAEDDFVEDALIEIGRICKGLALTEGRLKFNESSTFTYSPQGS